MNRPRPLRQPGLSSSRAEVVRREALEEVRAIYRELEARPIERACERRTECCQFRLTGRTPQLTKGEAVLAARALRASALSPIIHGLFLQGLLVPYVRHKRGKVRGRTPETEWGKQCRQIR